MSKTHGAPPVARPATLSSTSSLFETGRLLASEVPNRARLLSSDAVGASCITVGAILTSPATREVIFVSEEEPHVKVRHLVDQEVYVQLPRGHVCLPVRRLTPSHAVLTKIGRWKDVGYVIPQIYGTYEVQDPNRQLILFSSGDAKVIARVR